MLCLSCFRLFFLFEFHGFRFNLAVYLLCVKVSAEVFERINGDPASGLDVLHDKFHNVFRNANAAACIGAVDAEAVEEKSKALFFYALRVVTHIQNILIGIVVIRDVFAVFGIKTGNILDIDQLIEVHTLAGIPDQ